MELYHHFARIDRYSVYSTFIFAWRWAGFRIRKELLPRFDVAHRRPDENQMDADKRSFLAAFISGGLDAFGRWTSGVFGSFRWDGVPCDA